MGAKVPFSIRWEREFRQAFEALVGKTRIGRGADNASDLARLILEEWTICQYGLADSIRLNLLGTNSILLPYPEHLYSAIAKYEESGAHLVRSQAKAELEAGSVAEELSRHRKVAEQIHGSPAPRRKAKARA